MLNYIPSLPLIFLYNSPMYVYLNDRIVPEQQAVVSVYDHGFLYGDGVYETLRTYAGKVFMPHEHMARLARSASAIKLPLPKSPEQILCAIDETLAANAFAESYIRVSVTRGAGPPGLDPDLCPTQTFVIYVRPLAPYAPALYEDGVALTIPSVRRNLRSALDPAIKSHNFLNNILAKVASKEAGAYDALMLNHAGHLTECTISNFFFVDATGALCTPALDCGLLDGITRGLVIRLARGLGLTINKGHYLPDALAGASEALITNTTMEVMPVRAVDKWNWPPGPVTRSLQSAYKEHVNEIRP